MEILNLAKNGWHIVLRIEQSEFERLPDSLCYGESPFKTLIVPSPLSQE